MSWSKRLLLVICIRVFESSLDSKSVVLTVEQEDGLLSQMWQNDAFRKYITARNEKIKYMLAGGEGMEPEPRDTYLIHIGQRVENLFFGSKAKLAYERVMARGKQKIEEAKKNASETAQK